MGLNHSAIFAKIQELVTFDRPVSQCMGDIITICSRDVPHADWSRLSAVDYDGDVSSLTSWIAGVFEKQPAPFPIQGLWFGLCNPIEGGKVRADMYVGSVAQYAPDDEELSWLWEGERHYPANAYMLSAESGIALWLQSHAIAGQVVELRAFSSRRSGYA
jgi:hypothetical protein